MSVKATLTAVPRSETGKGAARRCRARGRVPAVVYGNDRESQPLTVDAREVEQLFQAISVENTLVDLTIDRDGKSETIQTLVREVQTHPFKPEILHVDFYAIRAGVKLEVEIPVRLTGTPVGVSEEEGVLEQILHEIRVRCLPTDIPEVIELDVRGLAVGDSFHVSDVRVGEGVEILEDPERAVCTVVIPRALLVEEEVEEVVEELELLEELEAEEAEAEEAEGAEAAPEEEGEEPGSEE